MEIKTKAISTTIRTVAPPGGHRSHGSQTRTVIRREKAAMSGPRRRREVLLCLVTAALACVALGAQQSTKPLTNKDVVEMVKGGVPESIIVSSIQSNASDFDLSPKELIALHKAGVTQAILQAMVTAQSKQADANSAPPATENPTDANEPPVTGMGSAASQPTTEPGTATTPVPSVPGGTSLPGLPTVTLLQEDPPQPIALEKTQLEETKTRPSSLLSLASDSVLTPVVQGEVNIVANQIAARIPSSIGSASVGEAASLVSGLIARRKPSQTYIWALPNPTSNTVLPTATPTFSVDFSDVAGIDPREYRPAIVKLTPAQNSWRLVGATQGREGTTSNSALDWKIYAHFLEERVPLKSRKEAVGQFQISPAAPLLPGEYAVVLRPVSKSKKFSGADVARDQGDGMAFDSAWSFSVPPDAKAQ